MRPALAALLTFAGVTAMLPLAVMLWSLWTQDPLKSVGALVPPVSVVLLARVWRALDWETDGSWWGLLLIAVCIAAVHLRERAVFELVVAPWWTVYLPPLSLLAVGYMAGAVLLFGGWTLLRAARFPVLLMFLVNPVPHVFSLAVDLPLQHVAASMARGLAHAWGQGLTPDQLRLMFTPQFGMFIAPGCNGIRGSVTMGLLALVAGYVYRFRRGAWALLVVAGVLLGYVFNLLRLCALVAYYVLALHFPSLQERAATADYVLGAVLFFLAAVLLFSAVRRFGAKGGLRSALPRAQTSSRSGRSFAAHAIALAVLTLLGAAPYARALAATPTSPAAAADPGRAFPTQLGSFRRRRVWTETLPMGAVIFDWAEYVEAGSGAAVAVGVSPVMGAHDTLICHTAHGDLWLGQGDLRRPTAGASTPTSAAFYDDGAVRSLEATTLCQAGHCGQFSGGPARFGLVYSRPAAQDWLRPVPSRLVPVMLRAEWPDGGGTQNDAVVRAALTARIDRLAGALDVGQLASQFR